MFINSEHQNLDFKHRRNYRIYENFVKKLQQLLSNTMDIIKYSFQNPTNFLSVQNIAENIQFNEQQESEADLTI